MPVHLKPREYEVFTVVPVKQLSSGASFAPVGLVNMYNSGGAIKDLKYESDNKPGEVEMKVRGCGIFGAYSSVRPERIVIDLKEVEFMHEDNSGLITLTLGVPEQELYAWNITIET